MVLGLQTLRVQVTGLEHWKHSEESWQAERIVNLCLKQKQECRQKTSITRLTVKNLSTRSQQGIFLIKS